MKIFNKIRDRKNNSNNEKTISNIEKEITFANKMVTELLMDDPLEDLKEVEETYEELKKLGAIDEYNDSRYKEKYDEIKNMIKNKEEKGILKLDIAVLGGILKKSRYIYEMDQIYAEEVYEELVHYKNVCPCNKHIWELCREKINKDTTIQENLKKQFLIIIEDEISKKESESKNDYTPDFIRYKKLTAAIEAFHKPAIEFYNKVIDGRQEIDSCTRIYNIRYAIWRLENNSNLDKDKKQNILTKLLSKREELRKSEYSEAKGCKQVSIISEDDMLEESSGPKTI